MKLTYAKRLNLVGWLFIAPAVVMIFIMSFSAIIQAFGISLQTGMGNNMKWTGFSNYLRILKDPTFQTTVGNTLVYLLQIPVMLGLALLYAQALNNVHLRCPGLYRVMIFLPCAMASVSYSLVFRILFASDGLINTVLRFTGLNQNGINFFGGAWTSRMVILIALVWRWTGYNMVFLSAAMQSIDPAIYEAATIDGASGFQRYFRVTLPLLRPTLVLLCIMTLSGTIQLFDESVNLTNGGPANATLSISHYIYNLAFKYTPNFGYATALSFVVFIVIAILTLLQMKVGDKRDEM
ncbi:MAG: sugar ABC transporter permease [Eubacteriales bacterium]|nr:sugar ABC transporter permease [Eubacteriales bacterium]